MSIKKFRKNTTEYIPKNPKKYVGRYPILVRSSWERQFFQWTDSNPNVLEWSSEPVGIDYYDPVQSRIRKYYPDAYMKIKTKYSTKKYIVEIKPVKDTRMPIRKGKMSEKTLRFQKAVYFTNKAKFYAAREYCKKMKMEFKVLTEKDLFTEYKDKKC